MLVLTLTMAAVGFALLVLALLTGSVVWAWGCIVVCVGGAVLLLMSSLRSNSARSATEAPTPAGGEAQPPTEGGARHRGGNDAEPDGDVPQ